MFTQIYDANRKLIILNVFKTTKKKGQWQLFTKFKYCHLKSDSCNKGEN